MNVLGRRLPDTRRLKLTLLAVLLVAGSLLAAPATAVVETRGYDGVCKPADSNGVTVVIDFQELDGNAGRAAPTIVRCSPVPGNDAGVRRTGLEALVDAGIVLRGTARWGDDYPTSVPFVCRIEGRPAADEPLVLTASGSTLFEPCGDTPPGDAYWSYWHADGQGGAWTYASLGVMNRRVTPGGFEGWSFSLNRSADDHPVPRVAPVSPTASVTFTADRSEIELGESVLLSWQAEGVSRVVAGGSWNGPRPADGQERVTPPRAGTFVYTLTTVGTEPEIEPEIEPGLERSVTLTVTGDDGTAGPGVVPPPHSASSHARQSAGWLVNELSPTGQLPGPTSGTDWGLSIDALWALYAVGTGAKASAQIATEVAGHAGTYLGPDLFGDEDARLGGSAAKLLVAAIVAGQDPEAFGRGRYLAEGETYDLRGETLRLLETSGAQQGRISNRGTGNDETNVFAQSLAVIGLARSGGVPADAVDFLVSQQCSAGYFRMFYPDRLSCDAARGTGDGDGTAMGVQALMTARDEDGVAGLDDEIDRGLDWLLASQRKDGSFGGGAGTEGSNSNSTGLIAQTLAAGARAAEGSRARRLTAAYSRARDWVLTVHARQQTAAGSRLASEREYGAIAYDRASFTRARSDGIGTAGRDTWRRATAQAIFALAPVSFADLGKQEPTGDPVEQNHPEQPEEDEDGGGGAAPPPGAGPGVPVAPAVPAPSGAATPAARLGAYLSSQLVDGDHVEVEVDGTTYVDYDATVELLFALTALGGADDAADDVAAFLLHPRSVDAFAHGVPYETARADYAEPIAKLSVVARVARARGHAGIPERTLRRLDQALVALEVDGRFEDSGAFADRTSSVVRQAWIVLALTAADHRRAAAAVEPLLGARCADGTFRTRLTDAPCASGDARATAVAVQAINSISAPTASTQPGEDRPAVEPVALPGPANATPASWPASRGASLQQAALAVLASTGRTGRPLEDPDDNALAADLAATRHAAGLDITDTGLALGRVQRADGGFTATATASGRAASDLGVSIRVAPALAGHGWAGAPRSPLVAAVQLPLADDGASVSAATAPRSTDSAPSTLLLALAGLLLLAIGLGAGLAGPRLLRRTPSSPPEVSAE